MSLDQYSLCPCGSGKKIKFCKCNEHFQEMQTVHRMIVGEQYVAALDRINADLKTMPSEPWLLAMKCELLLQLQEIDALEEASAKFIRLQPDNAQAKLYRALLAVFRGNTEEGATLLLQSIADSREHLSPLAGPVALHVIQVMLQRRMALPALLHAELLMDLEDPMPRVAVQAMESILGLQDASTLVQETLPSPASSDGTAYVERLAEAEALISNYRISAAKTKLESILREFGQQAPILQWLLHCQLLLSDVENAAMTCRKLAACTALDEAQRIYYQALVYELAPKSAGVTMPDDLSVYTIEDPEFEAQLASSKLLAPISIEQVAGLLQAFVDQEVPPKAAYATTQSIFREQFADAEIQRPGSWIAFYGKQTDKPARLVTFEPSYGFRKTLVEQVKKELGLTSLKRELIEQMHTAPLAIGSSQIIIRKEIPPERREALRDAIRQMAIDDILDLPFDCLGGHSPRQCAGMAEYRLPLQALLLQWQSMNPEMLDDTDFQSLHRDLQVSRPRIDAKEDFFDRVGGAAYYWIDWDTIDPRSLIQVMQSVLARSVSTMYRPLVARAQDMSWPDEFQVSAEYTLLNLKTRIETDPAQAEKLLQRIIETAKRLQLPVGNAVLERFDVLNMLGRAAEARQFLQSSFRENPNDPVLLQFLQAAMMQQQKMQAGGSPGGGAPIGAPHQGVGGSTTESGLWTPDAPAPSAASSGPSSGGSKLWIPGQD